MAPGPLLRSLLLALPEPQAFAAALASGADAVILDVAGEPSPEAARERAAACLDRRGASGPPVFVRVHPLASGRLDGDLDALVPARPEGVLLPHCDSVADVLRLSAMLAAREAHGGLDDGAVRILAGAADTPAGVLDLAGYREAGPRLAGLVLGVEGLSAALGTPAEAVPLTDPLRLARALLVVAAAAAGVAALDAPFPASNDMQRLAAEAEAARRDGYAGKVAIDPAQVPTINRVFARG